MLLADSDHDLCPMGCGRTTEDPYGGPCKSCWDAAPAPLYVEQLFLGAREQDAFAGSEAARDD